MLERRSEEGIERNAIAVIVTMIRRRQYRMRRQRQYVRAGIDRSGDQPRRQLREWYEGG